MNALFLAPGIASVGGMQLRDRLLIKAMDLFFRENDAKLRVLSLNDPSAEPVFKELQGLRVTKVIGFNADRLRFSLSAIRSFAHSDIVFYGLVGFAPLVYFQMVFSPSSNRFLLMHGTEVWQKRKGPYSSAIGHMTGAISISKYTLERYREIYRVPAFQKGFILPNSLRPDKSLNSSSLDFDRFSQSGNMPRLLSVARLDAGERLKGIDTVIMALPTLIKDFPNLKYVVIGDGSDRVRLENLARQLQVAHAVNFLGFVSELELDYEYTRCTLYVMPSASEGFGIVFIEAMAYGKPIIAAKAGGATEVVQDGVTGLLIEYGNVLELSQSLRRLLANPDMQRQMGQSGLQRVKAKYTFDVFCQNTAKILTQILKG